MLNMSCELCSKKFSRPQPDSTICKSCDRAMAKQYREEDSKKAKLWAANHKCKVCKKGLKLNRYFNCEECMVLETEDVWDDFDDSDVMVRGESVNNDIAKRRDENATEMFLTCTDCKVTKPRTMFHFMARKKTGRSGYCKPCDSKRAKGYRDNVKRAS